MTVYIILAYDDYYPYGDNIQSIFLKKEDALEYLKTAKHLKDFDRVEFVEYMVKT